MNNSIIDIISNNITPDSSIPFILNEAINFQKQCIFIAVPKAGTTSVRNQIHQQGKSMIPNPHLNIMQVRDSIYVYLLKLVLGKNTTFPTQAVHDDAYLRLMSTEIFTSFFKFAAVRNPWARAVSLYFRREGIQLNLTITFEEFCDKHFYASDTCRHPTLHTNQIDWLCTENENFVMDYVYKVENFDKAIIEIEELTDGSVKIMNDIANKNPNNIFQNYKNYYTNKSR